MKEDKNIQDFLDSGLLEHYVIGATTEVENVKVESFLKSSPEIRFAYDKLQEELLTFSKIYKKELPADLEDQVLNEIRSAAVVPESKNYRLFNWVTLAAIFTGLIAICGFWYSDSQKVDLENQLSRSAMELQKLKTDIAYAHAAKTVLESELDFIKAAETDKYLLKGNQKAANLLATAYYNKNEAKGLVELHYLPELDKEHDYQLWADVDGEMISMAVLNGEPSQQLDPNVLKNATSLNITIEPAGGNDHATVENLVAAVALNTQP